MLSLSDAFLRKRKSANAIWFSFICSRFFIFWFPLDREKLQYPFFMKANEKHSGLCARYVDGKCLLNGFNHEWQVFACSWKGFENWRKLWRLEKAVKKCFLRLWRIFSYKFLNFRGTELLEKRWSFKMFTACTHLCYFWIKNIHFHAKSIQNITRSHKFSRNQIYIPTPLPGRNYSCVPIKNTSTNSV